METILISIIYDTLTKTTASFISLIIPFISIYWLYKRTNKTKAESEIFRIGREICKILQEEPKNKSFLSGISYSYIDKVISLSNETNRDIAIQDMTKKLILPTQRNEEFFKENNICIPTTIMAIILDRYSSLVPLGVNWSGRGPFHSWYGHKISTDDSLFPFGTKLYRQWIERFDCLHNVLWMCLMFKNFFLKKYSETTRRFEQDENYHNEMLLEIQSKLSEVHFLHSKLITQLQVIDSSVNEKKLI